MKTKLLLSLVALAAFIGLVQVQARATKNNVGSQLPPLKVRFVGKDPALTGKPLIVEFWATWCPPCRTSIPHLNELYKKYQPKGLEAVGITKEDSATVRAFTKDVPIDYHVGLDTSGKVSSSFGVSGIPHALLVNKTGKIVWEGHPMQLQESQLEELLK
jgi:thiol-disulfide isomerase/thioredoxin